ncbi:undecaprenyl-diphosphate phosphatase [bacterium]|nr:undecaprenyl-diphosphate phosphatase [bacterium]
MNWLEALFLGVLQGLTEFLPVSSSGHLVISQNLLGIHEPQLFFDVLVHAGTLTAVLAYYRKLIFRHTLGCFRKDGQESKRLLLMIIAASIPTGLIGVLFQDFFESMFASPLSVGFFWLITGIALVLVPKLKQGDGEIETIRIPDALLVGVAQGLAILPGVSRSGATIIAGMSRGIHPRAAADFSFLISIPAIIGATFLQFRKVETVTSSEWGVYFLGFLSAAVVGYAAIALLINMLKRRKIQPFGWYCIAAGVLTIIWLGLL